MADVNENEHMSLKDRLFLSPTQKYKIYGTFPWKMIINIFLIISTTSQIVIVMELTSSYSRSEVRFFHEQFLAEGDKTDPEFPSKLYLYTINDLISHIQQSIDNYYSLKDKSITEIDYLTPLKDTQIALEFFYQTAYYNQENKKNYQKAFMINKDDLGPFKPDYRSKLREILRLTKFFRLNFTVVTYIPFNSEDNYKCFIWDIKEVYSFEQRNHYTVSLKTNKRACSESIRSFNQKHKFELEAKTSIYNLDWIHYIVICLSLVSIILIVKYIHTNSMIYYQLKSKYKKTYVEIKRIGHFNQVKQKAKWNLLSSKDKKKFFNTWDITALIGNIIQLLGSILLLYKKGSIMLINQLLIGSGCFISYLSIGRYLEFLRDYNPFISTILKAIPNALRYFFGVLPIYIGFILFGVGIFWRSERFASIPMAFITLLAMMNGDSVLDIISDLKGINFFIGQVYSYLFGGLFIAVVMNIFVSIIEEAYVESKMKNRNHWIYSFLKMNQSNTKEAMVSVNDSISNSNSNEDKIDMTKGPRKLYEKVRSKAILREAINIEMSRFDDKNLDVSPKNKNSHLMNIDNPIEQYLNKIDKALKELENIAEEVVASNESKMKSELKKFLQQNISHLKHNKIKVIEDTINSDN